jgi:hypothetical protein
MIFQRLPDQNQGIFFLNTIYQLKVLLKALISKLFVSNQKLDITINSVSNTKRKMQNLYLWI